MVGPGGALPASLPVVIVPVSWLVELVDFLVLSNVSPTGVVLLGWSERAGGVVVVVGLDKEKSPKESRRLPISPNELS